MDQVTLKAVHGAIPKHLFKRSALKSTLYMLYNLSLVLSVFAITSYSVSYLIPQMLFWPAIMVYWFVEGTLLIGIWVIGHECAHHAYSSNETLNDSVGFVLHSHLLVPYHFWKVSHNVHHQGTSHMNKDINYVPLTKKQYYAITQLFDLWIGVMFRPNTIASNEISCKNNDDDFAHDYTTDIPFVSLIFHFSLLTIGWPIYIFVNMLNQTFSQWTSKFMPISQTFNAKHNQVHILNFGPLVVLSLLTYISHVTSFRTVSIYYIGPYIITYLQHIDPRIPHYRDGAWTFVKGALVTIDRHYGWLINHLHHHIGDTHVFHHFFSRIPHYNAVEATQAIKPLLGEHYNFDETFFLESFWYSVTRCHYVDDDGDVLYYKQ